MVSLILIRWIVINPVDSTIQRLNNPGLDKTWPANKTVSPRLSPQGMFRRTDCETGSVPIFRLGPEEIQDKIVGNSAPTHPSPNLTFCLKQKVSVKTLG